MDGVKKAVNRTLCLIPSGNKIQLQYTKFLGNACFLVKKHALKQDRFWVLQETEWAENGIVEKREERSDLNTSSLTVCNQN